MTKVSISLCGTPVSLSGFTNFSAVMTGSGPGSNMTAIHELTMFEGYCRGGPINGKFLRHPMNFFPMSINGVMCGQYTFAFTHDWLWTEIDTGPIGYGILE